MNVAVQNINPLLIEQVQLAWKHAVRACNVVANDGRMPDTEGAIVGIVVALSQQLEYLQDLVQIAEQISASEQET